MLKSSDGLIYMLIRSNPTKKDSFEYGNAGGTRLRALQEYPQKRYHERTELYVIDVERGVCSLVEAHRVP